MASTPNKSRIFLYLAVSIEKLHKCGFLTAFFTSGNLIAFSAGIFVGWSSPITAKLTDETRLDENPFGVVVTNEQASWIASVMGLGGIFGPLLAGFTSTKFGRKKALMFCSGVPFLVSYLMLAFGKNIMVYYIARFIGGLAMGALMNDLPHFLSEISEDSIRGTVSSSMNVFLMSGMLYAYIVGPYLTIMWFNVSCAVWPAIFLVLFLLFVPESPYYLIAADDISGAIKSLKKFRSNTEENVTKEMEIIKYSIDQDKKNIASMSDVFKSKAPVKAIIITLGLLFFQLFSGIIVVLFNAQAIFNATGSDIPPEISTMIIGAVQLAASFITPLAVDRLGRKFLLLVSAVGMLAAEVPLGLYFYMNDTGQDISNISWLPILCLIVYIISYSLGFGIVPWTVMAEVFPANIKSAASTVSVCFCGLLSFTSTKTFASLNAGIGMGGTFWLYSAVCAIAVPFVTFYMFETKGRSFEEIQNILSQ